MNQNPLLVPSQDSTSRGKFKYGLAFRHSHNGEAISRSSLRFFLRLTHSLLIKLKIFPNIPRFNFFLSISMFFYDFTDKKCATSFSCSSPFPPRSQSTAGSGVGTETMELASTHKDRAETGTSSAIGLVFFKN